MGCSQWYIIISRYAYFCILYLNLQHYKTCYQKGGDSGFKTTNNVLFSSQKKKEEGATNDEEGKIVIQYTAKK